MKTYYAVNSKPRREVTRGVYLRQRAELKIARAFVRAALAAGYHIAVENDEGSSKHLTTEKSVLAEMFLTDEDSLFLYRPGDTGYSAWAMFVYGNSGWDVLHDYTTNLEPIMEPVQAIIDEESAK